MKDPDLIIPGPIPFADVTVQEAEMASKIAGIPVSEVVSDVRSNPEGVYERFFIPMGKVAVDYRILSSVSRKAAEADNAAKLMAMLDELEKAVVMEDGTKLTKKGSPAGAAYLRAIASMRNWLQDPAGRKPPYSIFAKGNQKLPFWAFSALPGITCPGAGDCLKNPETGGRGWCYSFASWAKATPFFRQLQNTILMRMEDKSWIEKEARRKFRPGEVVRLYVDGDMDSIQTLDYWMHFCERFPENSFYGYSKSWGLFRQWHDANGGAWPPNYVMNLSSGTSLERRYASEPEKFRAIVKGMMELRNPKTGLPVVRGSFRAVQTKTKFPKPTAFEDRASVKRGKPYRKPGTESVRRWTEHRAEVSKVAKEAGIKGDDGTPGKVFVCPGKCYACMPGGRHACGDRSMTGFAIVIGVH